MSICRFSDDRYQSDIYAYQTSLCVAVVHIAFNRCLFNAGLPPAPVSFNADVSNKDLNTLMSAWQIALDKAFSDITLQPIGGAFDGRIMYCASMDEARELNAKLVAGGYRVPARWIDFLK